MHRYFQGHWPQKNKIKRGTRGLGACYYKLSSCYKYTIKREDSTLHNNSDYIVAVLIRVGSPSLSESASSSMEVGESGVS